MDVKYQRVIDLLWKFYSKDIESYTLILRCLSDDLKKFNFFEESSHWNRLAYDVDNEGDFKIFGDGLAAKQRSNPGKFLEDVIKLIAKKDKIRSTNLGEITGRYCNHVAYFFGDGCEKMLKNLPEISIKGMDGYLSKLGNFAANVSEKFGNGFVSLVAQISSFAKNGRLGSLTLALIPMNLETIRAVNLWNNEKISGKRAADCVSKALIIFGVGALGAYLGGTLAAFTGNPTITFLGNLTGGTLGLFLANGLAHYLCEAIFNLPPTQALEDAYKYLGISHLAPDSKVAARFLFRFELDHPNNTLSGSQEAFCKLTTYMALIRAHRGETINE